MMILFPIDLIYQFSSISYNTIDIIWQSQPPNYYLQSSETTPNSMKAPKLHEK